MILRHVLLPVLVFFLSCQNAKENPATLSQNTPFHLENIQFNETAEELLEVNSTNYHLVEDTEWVKVYKGNQTSEDIRVSNKSFSGEDNVLNTFVFDAQTNTLLAATVLNFFSPNDADVLINKLENKFKKVDKTDLKRLEIAKEFGEWKYSYYFFDKNKVFVVTRTGTETEAEEMIQVEVFKYPMDKVFLNHNPNFNPDFLEQ